jgi:hypothetical protein
MDWFGRRITAGPVIYVAAEAGASITNRVAPGAIIIGWPARTSRSRQLRHRWTCAIIRPAAWTG